jgi:hypothetical protein
MIVVGCDTGSKGGIAVINTDTRRVLEAHKMPVLTKKTGNKNRSFLDETTLVDLLWRIKREYAPRNPGGTILATIEEISGPQSHDGIWNAWTFGGIYYGIRIAFKAVGYQVEFVSSQKWKNGLRVPADKGLSVARADEIFPEDRKLWRGPSGGKLDGPAEAGMIGLYGAQLWQPRGVAA